MDSASHACAFSSKTPAVCYAQDMLVLAVRKLQRSEIV